MYLHICIHIYTYTYTHTHIYRCALPAQPIKRTAAFIRGTPVMCMHKNVHRLILFLHLFFVCTGTLSRGTSIMCIHITCSQLTNCTPTQPHTHTLKSVRRYICTNARADFAEQCAYTGLFCEYAGLFCEYAVLFCGDVGLFCEYALMHVRTLLSSASMSACRALLRICSALLRRYGAL